MLFILQWGKQTRVHCVCLKGWSIELHEQSTRTHQSALPKQTPKPRKTHERHEDNE